MNFNIVNSSGGLQYHLRAMWNASRWRPFRQFVDHWLSDWLNNNEAVKKSEILVLVGPNAGYTLPFRFIQHFKRVIVVEPDPLAFALFQLRFQSFLTSPAIWLSQDFFSLKDKSPSPEKIKELFAAYPDATFIFCNVLGQLPIYLRHRKNIDVDVYMKNLGSILTDLASTYRWASYHDRFSIHKRRANEVIDHLTKDMFTSMGDKKEFPWAISRFVEHQIEFVRS